MTETFKISRNELRRLLILEMHAKAYSALPDEGDFYGELYQVATNGERLRDDLHQELRKSTANTAVWDRVEELMDEKYESLE